MKIFKQLAMKDLCSAAATSRSFRDVAETPNLWAKNDYDMSYAAARNDIHFLSSNRFSTIRAIHLERANLSTEASETVLRFVADTATVVALNLSMNDLRYVDSGLLVGALQRLQHIILGHACLTMEQCKDLIEELDRDGANLEILSISLNNLSLVPADVLGRVVVKSQKCDLEDTSLNTEQANAIMAAIAAKDENGLNKLSALNIAGARLEVLSAKHLRQVMGKLKELKLDFTHLSTNGIEAVLGELRFTRTLEILEMERADMRWVEDEILERALSPNGASQGSLRKLNLTYVQMSAGQIQWLLSGLTADTTLHELILNDVNLSNVSHEALRGVL